jgi:hypothetical protein
VGVSVTAGAERPVRVECHDHVHHYEFAWTATDDGPVITDLRITSLDNSPITTDSLKRIRVERLAQTAALADTPEQAESARKLREALEAAMRNIDPDEAVAAQAAELKSEGRDGEANEYLRDVAERGAAAVIAEITENLAGWDSHRTTNEATFAVWERISPETMARVREKARGQRRGRAPREFYRDVATWARDGRARGLVYAHVAEQAATWGRIEPSRDTIRRWIRRAEAEGFLTPGEIRAPHKKDDQRAPRVKPTSAASAQIAPSRSCPAARVGARDLLSAQTR